MNTLQHSWSQSDNSNALVLLFEDEPMVLARTSYELREAGCSNLIATGSLEVAANTIANHEVRIAILDIHTDEDEEAGLDLATVCMKADINIIFTTGREELLSKLVLMSPSCVLFKPYTPSTLLAAMQLALIGVKKPSYELDKIGPKDKSSIDNDLFYVRHKQAHVRIFYADVLMIQADRSVVHIYTYKERYTLSTTLRSLDRQLENNVLIRVDRSNIINIKNIERFDNEFIYFEKNMHLTRIPISQTTLQELKSRLKILKSK